MNYIQRVIPRLRAKFIPGLRRLDQDVIPIPEKLTRHFPGLCHETLLQNPTPQPGSNVGEIIERLMERAGMLCRMDGGFYWDTRGPFIFADIASVTLAATAKALYPVANHPILGGQYWLFPGKKLRYRLFGRITTVLTPGNGSFNILYGTGADANGVALMTGTPVALSASQTNLSWSLEAMIHARSLGATGTLMCTGKAHFNVGVIASTLQPILLPASAPAVSAACDLTAALIPSVQFLRSGSTAETMIVHDMEVTALN